MGSSLIMYEGDEGLPYLLDYAVHLVKILKHAKYSPVRGQEETVDR